MTVRSLFFYDLVLIETFPHAFRAGICDGQSVCSAWKPAQSCNEDCRVELSNPDYIRNPDRHGRFASSRRRVIFVRAGNLVTRVRWVGYLDIKSERDSLTPTYPAKIS